MQELSYYKNHSTHVYLAKIRKKCNLLKLYCLPVFKKCALPTLQLTFDQ